MTSLTREIIDLDQPDTWPSDLLSVLTEHHDASRPHEVGPLSNRFDAALYSVVEALQPVAQGTPSRNWSHVEDNIKQHLPGAFIGQAHVHPSPEFMRLAGCADWYRPL